MSFTLFKFLFIAVAIGLVVIFALLARQVLRKRPGKLPQPKPEKIAKEAKPRAGLGRKKAEPEPEPATPATPRRRQLQSFAESERIASGEAEPLLPLAPIADVEEAPAPPPLPPEPVVEPMPAASVPDEPEGDFNAEVLGRLESAFEAFEAGAITLAGYRSLLLGLRAETEQRIADLEPAGDGPELDGALTARESVLWCLDWADQHESGTA